MEENQEGAAEQQPEAPVTSEPVTDSTTPHQTKTKKKSKPKPKAAAPKTVAKKEKPMKTATKKAVKKSAAKKATAKRTVATGADRKSYKDDMVIKIMDPARADKMRTDSRRRVSFKKIKAGMTVAKYIAAGGDRLDLNIMDKLGIVSVK